MTANTLRLILLPCLLAFACANPAAIVDPVEESDDETASYAVTFTTTWSAATHPASFPANPHFSGLIGATHNSTLTIWQSGVLATLGLKDMAELGAKTALETEITSAIANGAARSVLSGGGIGTSPGTVELTFEVL